MTISIGLFAYPDMELLSFAGPYQVFATAQELGAENGGDTIRLVTIATSLDPVVVRGGAAVMPQATIHDHLDLTCLIIPGGGDVDAQIECQEVVDWLRGQARVVPIVASVCTGAFLLAQTGVLSGLQATTHALQVNDLRHRFPAMDVIESHRWVDTGRFVTSAGLSAGIDMALHLLERLTSHELAVQTARQLELS